MLHLNRTAPVGIVDLDFDRGYDGALAFTETAIGSALNVYLDAENLGAQDKAYAANTFIPTANISVGAAVAFGVCLQSPDQLSGSAGLAIGVDINIQAYVGHGSTRHVFPFVGWIDTAGAAITAGWHANNVVSDYAHVLNSHGEKGFTNTTILLDHITSAARTEDKFLAVGFAIRNQGTSASAPSLVDYTISARYAYKTKSTYDTNVN